jgi:hypothetical protein
MPDAVIVILLVILLLIIAAAVAAAAARRGLARGGYGAPPRRPAREAAPRHLIIDGLNLIHWLHERDCDSARNGARDSARNGARNGARDSARGSARNGARDSARNCRSHRVVDLGPGAVAAAIARTAPVFRKALRDPYGLLIYVIKDRDGTLNESAVRAAYQAAAEKYRVEITSVEQDMGSATVARGRDSGAQSHAARGRDSGVQSHAARGRDDFYTCLLARRYRCAVASEDRLRDFDEFRAAVPPFRTVTFTHTRALPANDFIRPSDSAYARLKRPRMLRFEQLLQGLPPAD